MDRTSNRYLQFRQQQQQYRRLTTWNAFLHRRRRYCFNYYHVPLLVVAAVGTAFTSSWMTEFRRQYGSWWNEIPSRNLSPTTTFTTVVRAFTLQNAPYSRLLEYGVLQQRRRNNINDILIHFDDSYSVTNDAITTTALCLVHVSSSSFRPISGSLLPFQNKYSFFRTFSTNINDIDREESWESVTDDEDSDELGDTFISTLEEDDNNNDDDDDNGDDIDILEEDTTDYSSLDDIHDVVKEDSAAATTSDPLVVEYEKWSHAVNRAISALEKKQFSLEKEFAKAEQLESLQTRGQYLQSYRYMFTNQIQTVTVQDWDTGEDIVLTLDSTKYDSIGDEIDAIFTETKKLKRGKKVVGTLLEQTIKAIESMKGMKRELDDVLQTESKSNNQDSSTIMDHHSLRFIQERLIASAPLTNFKPPMDRTDQGDTNNTGNDRQNNKKSSYISKPALGTPSSNIRKVISPAGCTILVGRNRRGNEYLSLNLAKKNDIWMHARDIPGAHVLVVQRRGGGSSTSYATEACFQLAADLAAFYSDGRSERKVPVSAAEPKHIQKPRGAPLGAVKVREELRVYSGRPDAVPDELKEARAVSGLSNEYRIRDKSKLRKQNQQQVTEQKQLTKRKIKEKAERQKEADADKFY